MWRGGGVSGLGGGCGREVGLLVSAASVDCRICAGMHGRGKAKAIIGKLPGDDTRLSLTHTIA